LELRKLGYSFVLRDLKNNLYRRQNKIRYTIAGSFLNTYLEAHVLNTTRTLRTIYITRYALHIVVCTYTIINEANNTIIIRLWFSREHTLVKAGTKKTSTNYVLPTSPEGTSYILCTRNNESFTVNSDRSNTGPRRDVSTNGVSCNRPTKYNNKVHAVHTGTRQR